MPDQEFNAGHWSNADSAVQTVAASGAAVTLDGSDVHQITLTAACTITTPQLLLGGRHYVVLTQDGSGSRLVTWTTVKWAAGTAPTLSTAAGSVDVIRLDSFDGVSWFGTVIGKAFA
jgi:hypothetical protein